MKYASFTNFFRMISLLAFVVALSGCPGPSSDELDQAKVDFNQSRITDNGPAGKCDTATNREVIRVDNHDFADKWLAHGSMSGLDVDALQRDFPSVSKDCVDCFGAMTSCALGKCWKTCRPVATFGYGPTSKECKECSQNGCGAEMIKCTGLLPEEWPDFKRD